MAVILHLFTVVAAGSGSCTSALTFGASPPLSRCSHLDSINVRFDAPEKQSGVTLCQSVLFVFFFFSFIIPRCRAILVLWSVLTLELWGHSRVHDKVLNLTVMGWCVQVETAGNLGVFLPSHVYPEYNQPQKKVQSDWRMFLCPKLWCHHCVSADEWHDSYQL